tara:strand:- start:999 stop:1628 length:630 start_codon:yes stop_codon:yes gene_type:complete
MDSRSLSRELSLIALGLVKDSENLIRIDDIDLEKILESAVETLINHCRQELDECQIKLESASQNLLESEFLDHKCSSFESIKDEIKQSFSSIENVMNILSDTLDLPRLIAISDCKEFRINIKEKISKVLNNLNKIDHEIDDVMESWRFRRLPRIDRDILRLAYVEIEFFNIPISVSCNEAVLLANKYSDDQGRKKINGVLRRLQKLKVQ